MWLLLQVLNKVDLLRAPEVERLQASLLDRSGADAVIPTCATQVLASAMLVLPDASRDLHTDMLQIFKFVDIKCCHPALTCKVLFIRGVLIATLGPTGASPSV